MYASQTMKHRETPQRLAGGSGRNNTGITRGTTAISLVFSSYTSVPCEAHRCKAEHKYVDADVEKSIMIRSALCLRNISNGAKRAKQRKGFCQMKEQEKVELCETFCPADCVYRTLLRGTTPACYYAAYEHKLRGCKISECDKYRSGAPLKPTMGREYTIWWEYDYYDEDDNTLW